MNKLLLSLGAASVHRFDAPDWSAGDIPCANRDGLEADPGGGL